MLPRSLHIPKPFTALLFTALFISVFSSCTKEEPLDPMEQAKQYLTGIGNRYWTIKEMYVNGTKVALTPSQMAYNKTYTSLSTSPENTGTFSDSDGNKGTWVLNNATNLTETIENNPNGPVRIVITLKEIGPNKLDEEYTANGQTTRTVFFAY